MPRKPAAANTGPVYFVPRRKGRRGAKSAALVKQKPEPKYFARTVELPTGRDRKWRGWQDPMPENHQRCPSCDAAPGAKHLAKCPKPNIKRLWGCPSCGAAIGTDHFPFCIRLPFPLGVWDQSLYSENNEYWREIMGLNHQLWHGGSSRGSLDPIRREQRVQIYLSQQKGGQRNYPEIVLTSEERKELKVITERKELKVITERRRAGKSDDDDLPF